MLEVEFYVDTHKENLVINRKVLTDGLLSELVDRGFSLANTTVNTVTLAEILMEQENSVTLEACHTKLGFQICKSKTYYFGNEEVTGKIPSKYTGTQALSYNGAFCEWRAFVEEVFRENPLLALPIAMGITAPIATRLKNAGLTDETALWALIGSTSTGKTTSLKLSASVWGKPSGDGIIDNLTGTEKYFFASLADREGFPNYFDETSAVSWDFTKAIYTVALSREGGRCNTDGTPKKRKTWSGAVIFTGETSMFHRTNGNGGLYARLVEFDFSWFVEETLPDKISRFVAQNYGTAWMQYICFLQSIDDALLTSSYDEKIIETKKNIALSLGYDEDNWETKKFTGVQNRIVKKLALLLLALDTMFTAWDISADRAKIVEYIKLAYEHNASRIDKIDAFKESFVQHIAAYRKVFPEVYHTGFDSSAKSSARGFQDKLKGRSCVWVLAEEFEDQLLKHGLDASPSTLKELHNRGIIEHFKDRYRKVYKTGNISPSCYCFYPQTYGVLPTKNKAKNKNKKSKQLKSLLDEN